MAGKLYLCATPIGNLEDMTFRVIRTLKEVDLIAAEDTRNSIKLLNHLGLKKPMVSYHRHNCSTAGPAIVDRLLAGESCALVTDAGTPAISDPGEELVRQCAREGIPVNVVDDLALCSFVFPALVRRGELSVGISTGGASPSAAQYIRRLVEEQVPDGFEEILDFLAARRAQLKSALPAERRSAAYAALFSRCMELGRALTDGEFSGFMEEI